MEEYIKNIDLQKVSMQTLAFIGDAVHNLYIKMYLSSISNEKTGKLHIESIKYISAAGQAKVIDNILNDLSEEEINIYKRGRNTNIQNVSKNVDVVRYKKATGFEALIGYLYLTKNINRLEEIIKKSIEITNMEVSNGR